MSEIFFRTGTGPAPSPGRVEALLLAAGRGERLRPLTDTVPKPALPLPGAPLGAWMLEGLLARFDPVVVNCSHRCDILMAQLELEGRSHVLQEGPAPLGTGGTLAWLRERTARTILVANSDVIADLDVDDLTAAHERSGALATILVKEVPRGADFTLTGEVVTGFVDRRERKDAPGAVFLGVSLYERAALESLSDEVPLGLGESLLKPLAEEGRLAACIHHSYATDVGTPARYLAASQDVLSGIAPPPPAGPYESFRGSFLDVDGGRAFIAASAECAPESVGPGAVVLAGARLPRDARVERAIVWPNEEVPPGAEIQDCIWFERTRLHG